jgi:hypothetical protein
MRPKSRPVGNTGLKVLLLVLYEVALLEQGGGGVVGLSCPPLPPLPTHDPVHECALLFILLLLLAGIRLNECTSKDSSSGYLSVYSGPSEFGIRNHF